MRLTAEQVATITETVRAFAGNEAQTTIFGSRVRDDAKGGDVDLLVESGQELKLLRRTQLKVALEERLALPVDVLTKKLDAAPTPFERIALETGVRL